MKAVRLAGNGLQRIRTDTDGETGGERPSACLHCLGIGVSFMIIRVNPIQQLSKPAYPVRQSQQAPVR
ncbi:hypothetical protein ABEW60_07230 [Paenibacillus jamilae]|uniref:hypothetical protein n=1 Tax=Paenibacillus jamilae TaxID=114136 RepID=UPI003D2B072C